MRLKSREVRGLLKSDGRCGKLADQIARLVAQKLTEQTGKNFFVENISGAGGNVGAIRAANSSPDGYIFLVTGGNITNNQYLFADPGYDPVKDSMQ